MSVPTAEEIVAWTPEERAEVARALSVHLPSPVALPRARRRRALVLAVCFGGALVLLPWIGYLFNTLPPRLRVRNWRFAWVGFDIALAAVLLFTGLCAWRRIQPVLIGLAVTGTLFLVDAWFDVVLSWQTSEQRTALLTALLAEIPLGVLFVVTAFGVLRRLGDRIDSLSGTSHQSMWRRRVAVPLGTWTGRRPAQAVPPPPPPATPVA